MVPIFITIGDELPLIVIPDTQIQGDGHPILTYTYSIYQDKGNKKQQDFTKKKNEFHLEKHKDPNYMGFITFEDPGRLFTYTADGQLLLSPTEVEEIIEQISYYRDTPDIWEL